MAIFKVSRNTIYNWFNNWEYSGLVGLYNHSGQEGLEVFFLPTYSPYAKRYPLGQLNIIEIFWRFMKYQWLDADAYESYSALVEAVEEILINFGTKYTINFA